MNVPKHILKYCDELEVLVNDPEAVLDQTALAKLAEVQGWLEEYYGHMEENVPTRYTGMSNEKLDMFADALARRINA